MIKNYFKYFFDEKYQLTAQININNNNSRGKIKLAFEKINDNE
jgi:hypothetical protein